MAAVNRDVSRDAGVFASRRPRLGNALVGLGYLYALGMVLRYGLTMALHPERRWLHGAIPIVFHWVLAGYLWTLGRYQRSARGVA